MTTTQNNALKTRLILGVAQNCPTSQDATGCQMRRNTDEQGSIGLKQSQVADPSARDAQHDQDQGTQAAGRREDGSNTTGQQCTTPIAGLRVS
jgi:hypothetical protein